MVIDPAPANQDVLNFDERLVDVVAPLVPHTQSPGPLLPTERALRYPAVAPQRLAAVQATASQARLNAALAQSAPQGLGVVSFIGMNLLWTVTWPAAFAPHKGNCIYHRQKPLAVSHIRSRQSRCQGQAILVYDLMALRACFAPVHRRRANRLALRPPFFAPRARIKMLSTLVRLQSIWWAASSLASRVSCSVCQTHAWCQSRRRRQQVMPEPQPISAGRSSQASPVLRTNRMPVKARRSAMGGRPRLPGWARCGGRSGSTTAHKASLTSSFAITGLHPAKHFC